MAGSAAAVVGHEAGAEPPVLDEATLIARAQDGDVAAFEQLVLRYENRLYRYAYGMLGNRQDAEDVLQDALIRTWRALPALTSRESFSGWVYRITTRRCLDVLAQRRAQRTDPVDPYELPEDGAAPAGGPVSASPDPTSAVENKQQIADLAQALHHLPADQRACWLLREVHENSYQEIAAALAIPESTVRGRLAQARRHLAKGMSSWQ